MPHADQAKLLEEEARGRALPGMAVEAPSFPAGGVRSLDDVLSVLGGGSADGLARALLRRRDREASSGALTLSSIVYHT